MELSVVFTHEMEIFGPTTQEFSVHQKIDESR